MGFKASRFHAAEGPRRDCRWLPSLAVGRVLAKLMAVEKRAGRKKHWSRLRADLSGMLREH